jgi:uncharacterized membrane protein
MNLPRPLRYTGAFIVALVVFLALDSIWLTLMAQRLYRPAVGELMREDFDVLAAALFYLIYIGGLLFFVIAPARHASEAWLRGALFGFVAYATYDLTNQATLRVWSWQVTLADLAWGACVTSTSGLVAYWLLFRARRD